MGYYADLLKIDEGARYNIIRLGTPREEINYHDNPKYTLSIRWDSISDR